MKIIFLTDFRGRETNEHFYQAGEVADFDDQTAERLIADKRAELAEQPTPEAQPAKKGKAKK